MSSKIVQVIHAEAQKSLWGDGKLDESGPMLLLLALVATTPPLALSPASPPTSKRVDILVAPPCLSTFRGSGRVGSLADDHAAAHGGSSSARAMGPAGLFRNDVLLVTDPENVDGPGPKALLEAIADADADIGVDPVTTELVAEHHWALKSPEELSFLMPGGPDGLLEAIRARGDRRGQSPDLSVVPISIVRLRSARTGAAALLVRLLQPDLPGMHGDTDANLSSARPDVGRATPTGPIIDVNVGVSPSEDGAPPSLTAPIDPASSTTTAITSTSSGTSSSPLMPSTDPLAWDNFFVMVNTLQTGAGEAKLVSSMLSMGGPARLKVDLDNARREAAAANVPALVLMTGGIAGYPPLPGVCAEAARIVRPDVVLPRQVDLARGGPALKGWAKIAGVPMVAANLLVGTEHFQSTLVRDVNGKRIAIVGVVDPDLQVLLPEAAQASLTITDPINAATEAVEALLADATPPDLIIVAASSRNLVERMATIAGVDIVVGGIDGRTDSLHTKTVVTIEGRREETREPAPSLITFGSIVSVRRLRARFDVAGGLAQVEDDAPPVNGWSPQDHTFARPFRAALLQDITRDADLLLPKLDGLLAAAPTAAALARGRDIAYRGRFVTVPASASPMWSDALFHRLAANAIVQGLDVDVAFTANTARSSDLGNSAVAKRFVRDWLAGKGPLEVVAMPGAALKALIATVATQESAHHPALWVYSAAVDAKEGVVRGRPIDNAVTYRVALDEKTARRRDIAAIIAGLPAIRGFARRGADGAERIRFDADDAGQMVNADEVVIAVLEEARRNDAGAAVSSPAAGTNDVRTLASLLLDTSAVVRPEWRLTVDTFELRGTGGQTSENIAAFAETKETRASQPGFLQIGAKANASLLYDTAPFAWESRLRLQYDTILLDVEGAPAVPQDTVDDIVLSTEGRLNSISLQSDSGAFRIVPFAQVALDSELTPTANAENPDGPPLPQQALIRQSVGIAAYPGSYAKEIRLGLLLQEDAGDALAGVGDVRFDFGAGVEWHLQVPIWKVIFSSDVDVRYFIPDGDDRPSDLALRAQLVHKLALPLTPRTSVFVFFDAMMLVGKVASNDELGYNGIIGGGAQFSDLFRF